LVQHIFGWYVDAEDVNLFVLFLQTLIEGAMTGYTDNGMKIAQDTLVMLIGSSCTEKKNLWSKQNTGQ